MKKRVINKNIKKEEGIFKNFFLGIILVIFVQAIFMLGGLLIENKINTPITGIPSAIGLTVVLILGLLLIKKSEYILLGSFTLAFISPLILGMIVIFKAMNFTAPHIYYSIAYLVAVILIVWIYYINKILKGKL